MPKYKVYTTLYYLYYIVLFFCYGIFILYYVVLYYMLTNYGRCTCEIKSRIAMAKAAFNKKRALFNSTLDLKLRKKPVKWYI